MSGRKTQPTKGKVKSRDPQTESEAATSQDETKALEVARNKARVAQENVDQGGLHTAAERGHLALVADLIQRGAYVDYPDSVNGRTALHLAVQRGRVEVVQLLLYHGADPTLLDRDGCQPSYFCKSAEMKKVLADVMKQSEGNSQGDVNVDCVTIQSGRKRKLKNVDISILDPKDTQQNFTYSCRRQIAEHSDVNFQIANTDEVLSDTFVHRVSNTTSRVVKPIITIPLFGKPNKGEELLLKTDQGDEIPLTDVFEEEEKWYSNVRENVRKFNSFVVVSRKKKEVFTIGKQAVKVVSTVNERVELDIPANAFDSPTELTMEISEIPEEAEVDELETPDVVSYTPFCSIDAGGKTPRKPITVKLPLPPNFSGSEESMRLLTMNEDEEDEDEDSWEFLQVKNKIENGRISFDLTSFSVKVAVQPKTFLDEESLTLKRQVSLLYRASRRRTYSVVFIALVMPVAFTSTFKIVVECCQDTVAMERKEYWETQGFRDQRPSISAPFTSISKQSYSVTLDDCFRINGPNQTLTLEFHPKRFNFQVFCVEVINPLSEGVGHVQIEQLPPSFLKNEDPDKLAQHGYMLTNIVVELKGRSPRENIVQAWVNDSTPEEKEEENVVEAAAYFSDDNEGSSMMSLVSVDTSHSTDTQSPEYDTGFMDKEFVVRILQEADGDDWFRIYMFMGLTFQQIEKAIKKAKRKTKHEKTIKKLAKKWQKSARSRDDRGLRPLLCALKMGGRLDIRMSILVQMRQWYSYQEKLPPERRADKALFKWITDAYANLDILDPSGYPTPMSDQSLVLIAGFLMPSLELAKGLGLSKFQLTDVLNNRVYVNNEMQVMKLLKMSLEQIPDQILGLEALLKALDSDHLEGARDYFIMTSKAWVSRSSNNTSVQVQRIASVLDQTK